MYDVPANELIEKISEKLKQINEIKPPEWAAFVKTGRYKERPPFKEDWWYVRAASVLRTIYKLGPIGVSKLRRRYGGKKNRGVKPERFYKGSGSIIRKILQQLEKAELVKKEKKKIHKGRILTAKGKSLLDKTASELLKGVRKSEISVKPKKAIKKEVKKEGPKEKPKGEVKGGKAIGKEAIEKKPLKKESIKK